MDFIYKLGKCPFSQFIHFMYASRDEPKASENFKFHHAPHFVHSCKFSDHLRKNKDKLEPYLSVTVVIQS